MRSFSVVTPTLKRLRELFLIRQDGAVLWLNPPANHNELRGKVAGSRTPGSHGKDYWNIQIDGYKYKRSRIVFCMIHGRWPEHQIDHIDGNSLNDAVENLREATMTQNMWNHKKRAKQSPLPMGVRMAVSGRYVARISVNKRHITIGTFDSYDDAAIAYKNARSTHFGEFA